MKFNKELGGALHTALRTCCDSSPTSAAWNLICELDENSWLVLLDTIREGFKSFEFKKEKRRTEQVAAQLKLAVSAWKPWGGDGHIAVALRCVFNTFSDSDWYGFAEFLETVIIKERKTKPIKAAA